MTVLQREGLYVWRGISCSSARLPGTGLVIDLMSDRQISAVPSALQIPMAGPVSPACIKLNVSRCPAVRYESLTLQPHTVLPLPV
jgi:hypothetical protein